MILGFAGSMGSGKSTAISFLQKHTGRKVRLVKFAQPLYDIQEFVYDRIKSVHKRDASFVKDRKLLQWVGTEWGRGTISETLWVDLWKAEVAKLRHHYPEDILVCDDVRFDNEAGTIRSIGGKVIRITSKKNLERITTANGIQNHSSEKGISDNLVDYELQNEYSMEKYRDDVMSLYDFIKRQ